MVRAGLPLDGELTPARNATSPGPGGSWSSRVCPRTPCATSRTCRSARP
jgi:hypothetical protein